MLSIKQEKSLINFLMYLALCSGLVYILFHLRSFYSEIRSGFVNEGPTYFFPSNICYLLQGFVFAGLPLMFMLPFRANIKQRAIKAFMAANAVIYAVGSLWIFVWLWKVISGGGYVSPSAFQREYTIYFSHLNYADRDFSSLIFSVLQAIFWYHISRQVNRDRRLMLKYYIAAMCTAFLAPAIYYIIVNGAFPAYWWLERTAPVFACHAFMLLAFIAGVQDRERWKKCICPLKHRTRGHHHHHHHTAHPADI